MTDDDEKTLRVATMSVDEIKNKTPEERKEMMREILGDDLPAEVQEAIGKVMDHAANDTLPHGAHSMGTCTCGKVHKPFTNVQESMAELMEFNKVVQPTVGMMVKRNKFGMNTYKTPDEADFETAMVVEVFPTYQVITTPKQSVTYNGIIAVAMEHGDVSLFPVDLRCYEQVTPANGTGSGN